MAATPLFVAGTPSAVRDWVREGAAKPLSVLDAHLAGRPVLLGETFTVADAYLVWALAILPCGGVPLDACPAVTEYPARHLKRPAAAAAIDLERREYGAR